jgi:acyl carrier protein
MADYLFMSNDGEIFQKLKEVLAKVLQVDPEAITPSSSMDNLPIWDSLRFVQVITETEKTFGLRLNGSDARSFVSVQNLIQVIEAERRRTHES